MEPPKPSPTRVTEIGSITGKPSFVRRRFTSVRALTFVSDSAIRGTDCGGASFRASGYFRFRSRI